MTPAAFQPGNPRLATIARARELLLGGQLPTGALPVWVERSWQRCLQHGLQPQHQAVFEVVNDALARRTLEANQHLVHTARPILENLGRAIVNTRYFAILTNREGVVVDNSGPIDHTDPRAHLITRVGTDLSERSVGTTAISTALAEQQPVWLHRGEHFFSNTAIYSCAGAPLIGPDGSLVGMLDLTGIDALERPELKHLVTQTAIKIENALVLAQDHALMLRLNWPGSTLGSEADGLLCLDADGWVTAANPIARQMVPHLGCGGDTLHPTHLHVSELFGMQVDVLFDALRHSNPTMELPLWTGLRLRALPVLRADESQPALRANHTSPDARHLKDIETALIRQAVDQARGNVAQAAQALGISRATVYRKMGQRPKH
ncbi:MAG: histidine kinase [Burkholderiales bacterium PBB3]|nr:MAG: histidine kinase [Burkholderiales bacterium PBB3]